MGRGVGLRGGTGIQARGAGCAGIRAPARGGMGFGPRVRGGVGIRARRGVEWGFGPPGAGCGGDSGPARGGVGIRAPARSGDFFGKMGNFLPFCRFFAVWVEICISSRLCMILNITPTQQIRIPVKIIHIVI